ncbi:SphA family protein [Brenneria uluponensis]|uniref:SphA family protein n=1 Tax=Brenneria uluponensis TaxID=3057057 RepID=UPI0028E7D33C|nr:transporter [Brenneria ulupoensis]
MFYSKSVSEYMIYSVMLYISAITGYASAAEGISPLQPGATTGNAAGVLPPPGLYLMMDTDYEGGKLKNGQGKTARTPAGQSIKASNVSSVMALVWVPGWEMLGARYAVAVAQPYKWARTRISGADSSSIVSSSGMVNTAITPAILSWNLGGGYYLGSGLTLYTGNGKFRYTYDASTGRNVKASTSIGNDYWTVEPNLALTYLADDWNITFNNILDINTTNKTTDYRSGITYYLDVTVAKNINNFTVGLIGNYTKQITDDKLGGKTVSAISGFYGEGNRMEHVLVGPLLAYDFGSFSVNARILLSLRAKNDADVSFFHLGFSMPIK